METKKEREQRLKELLNVHVNDIVIRNLADLEMKFRVTDVTDNQIICGDWTFDRKTGLEEDPDLEWGVTFGKSGSYIRAAQEPNNTTN